ncbi:MAG: helix-turn-helix domain-containing protein, partial [Saprospiraceae bacterium]
GHLTHFVESGELNVSELMAAEDVEKIAAFFTEKPAALSSEAYAHFEQAYSYGQIKLVMASLKKEQLGV